MRFKPSQEYEQKTPALLEAPWVALGATWRKQNITFWHGPTDAVWLRRLGLRASREYKLFVHVKPHLPGKDLATGSFLGLGWRRFLHGSWDQDVRMSIWIMRQEVRGQVAVASGGDGTEAALLGLRTANYVLAYHCW